MWRLKRQNKEETKSDSWLGFSLCEKAHKHGKLWYNNGV